MNNKRRKKIDRIYDALMSVDTQENLSADFKKIQKEIDSILYDEQDAFDNLPEGLQYSYNGQRSEEAIASLEEASDIIGEYQFLRDEEKKDTSVVDDIVNRAADCLYDAML